MDYLRLISSGIMLITTKNREELNEKLKEKEIDASIMGRICQQDVILVGKANEINIESPKRDKLFNI